MNRVDPRDLAAQLGVDIANPDPDASTRTEHDWGAMAFAPFKLAGYPAVAEALAKATKDRSADTIRIIGACFDAGLSLPHARWAIHNRADLVERLEEMAARRKPIDDVAVCWEKIAPGLTPPVLEKADTNGQPAPVLLEATGGPLQDALDVFGRWLHLEDPAAVLLTAAAVIANRAEGDPVWLLLVGPPSCGKTEILRSLGGLEHVHPVAALTEASLLSGSPRREKAAGATGGVLRQVGQFGILLCKDFTSVLSQDRAAARSALAALREIYDGSWDRPLGTDGGRVLHWEGKCGFVGAVVPSYDRYSVIVNTLGDRYLLLRLPSPDPERQAHAALANMGHERQMRAELAEAMTGLIGSVDPGHTVEPLSDTDRTRLVRLAQFAAWARTGVERDGYTRAVEVLPRAESPARLTHALHQVHNALAALGVGAGVRWGLLTRLAVECAPAARIPVIGMLAEQDSPDRTADIATALGADTKFARRVLEDLALLGIAVRTKRTTADNSPDLWTPSPWLLKFWPGWQE